MLRARIIAAAKRLPGLRAEVIASSDYRLGADGVADGWTRRRVASRQDAIWAGVIRDAEGGVPRADLVALAQAITNDSVPAAPAILEVGCGSGYVSRYIHRVRPDATYVGVDSSPAMLALARARNPGEAFVHGDATALPFADASFDVVIDGAALMHIGDERRAIAEYARVARVAVVLHSVTCSESTANTTLTKQAYGAPVREYVYARALLIAAAEAAGLQIEAVLPGLGYDLTPHVGIATVSETWLLSHAE